MPGNLREIPVLLVFAAVTLANAQSSENPPITYSTLADSQVRRAQDEVKRIESLVENGTLPRIKLREAQERLADAQDQDTLAHTLYGSAPVEKMTETEAQRMKEAAERRVMRQQTTLAERQQLLDSGVIARTDWEAAAAELETRKQVLDLVGTRLRLLDELKRMAETERRVHTDYSSLKDSMIRYDGNGAFKLADMASITARFRKKFGHTLPVSAVGQTAVHQALGLDHRERVDVALNPESKEGLWLRRLLESLHLPYLAFRSAVVGAATAPHIHLGTGSTRLTVTAR